jgi:hypothetical protein
MVADIQELSIEVEIRNKGNVQNISKSKVKSKAIPVAGREGP